MKLTSKYLTRSAVCAAVGVALLYIASVLPSGRLGMLCVSGATVIFVLMSCGRKWALGCFAVTSVLGILLLPDKAVTIAYAVFAGWYPVVKLALERVEKPLHRWLGKFSVFNAAFIPGAALFRDMFFAGTKLEAFSLFWIILGANLCFFVYDYACKYVILFYIRNIARRIK